MKQRKIKLNFCFQIPIEAEVTENEGQTQIAWDVDYLYLEIIRLLKNKEVTIGLDKS